MDNFVFNFGSNFLYLDAKQTKKIKLDRYDNFSNDDRDYYLYGAATND